MILFAGRISRLFTFHEKASRGCVCEGRRVRRKGPKVRADVSSAGGGNPERTETELPEFSAASAGLRRQSLQDTKFANGNRSI